MAYQVDEVEHTDSFISYARLEQEWIRTFRSKLKKRAAEVAGRPVEIWWDEQMTGTDSIPDLRLKFLNGAQTLICVVSPAFLKSPYCQDEVRAFLRRFQAGGQLRKRLFKVTKLEVKRDQEPPELRLLHGFDFFERDGRGNAREFTATTRAYQDALNDVAYKLAGALENDGVPAGPTVFLGETTEEMRALRLDFKRELERAGAVVLPEGSFDDAPDDALGPAIAQDLGRARLSVHMLGGTWAPLSGDPEVSVQSLQLDAALARARQDRAFRAVVWTPPSVPATAPLQAQLLERVRQQTDRLDVMLSTNLETLEEFVGDILASAGASSVDAAPADGPLVYLMHHEDDARHADDLQALFQQEKLLVRRSLFDGDESAHRTEHESLLRECDAAIVVWRAGSQQWLRTQLSELKRAAAFERSSTILARSILALDAGSNPARGLFMEKGYSVFRSPARVLPREALITWARNLLEAWRNRDR